MPDTPTYSSMQTTNPVYNAHESRLSALSWPGIIGGAVAMLATSLILVTLGGAFNLSPMPADNMEKAKVVTAAVGIWLVITQWISSFVGGYLAGRMRTKWSGVHTHEVYFRDTAHGFLAWSVATLAAVLMLGSFASNAIGHMHAYPMSGMHGQHANGSMSAADGPMSGYLDQLYRGSAIMNTRQNSSVDTQPASTDTAAAGSNEMPLPSRMGGDYRGESGRLLVKASASDDMSNSDKSYLAQLVASRTGLSQADAMSRVNNVVAEVRDDATKARKAAGTLALFTGLSMLIGAFIASAAAAFGGVQRDEWEDAVTAGTYGKINRP